MFPFILIIDQSRTISLYFSFMTIDFSVYYCSTRLEEEEEEEKLVSFHQNNPMYEY